MVKQALVVVTGGGRGIGVVFARYLRNSGAKVVITGRDPHTLKQAATDIGEDIHYVHFDVTSLAAVQAAFEQIETDHGPIDTLVNNAGVWGPVEYFWQSDADAWCDAIDINLKGTALCTHAALERMVTRQHGQIINIVSNAGVFRWPTASAYSVSKAAVIKLTENLAVEAKAQNISIFAYHPGLIHSVGMSVNTLNNPPPAGTAHEKAVAWFLDEQKEGRTVDARQGAEHIIKLSSGEFSALSGRYLTVYDDLDELQQRNHEVKQQDLLTLRVRSLLPKPV